MLVAKKWNLVATRCSYPCTLHGFGIATSAAMRTTCNPRAGQCVRLCLTALRGPPIYKNGILITLSSNLFAWYTIKCCCLKLTGGNVPSVVSLRCGAQIQLSADSPGHLGE